MTLPTHYWPSKLLLFGEHTVLRGSRALAIPLTLFGARWAISNDTKNQYDLPKMADWLRVQPACLGIDVDMFLQSLTEGWHLAANIPQGYGVGSSGVVCAALLTTFGLPSNQGTDLAFLKVQLANMEGFFHGSSSGIDPLVSFVRQPILLNGSDVPKTVATSNTAMPDGAAIFLLDTKLPRSGAPFIQYVSSQCTQPNCLSALSDGYLSAVDEAIDSYLAGNWEALLVNTSVISQFQQDWWPEVIPEKVRPIWQAGLQNRAYFLKTCGAGGGGFVLGITPDWAKTQLLLTDWTLHKL